MRGDERIVPGKRVQSIFLEFAGAEGGDEHVSRWQHSEERVAAYEGSAEQRDAFREAAVTAEHLVRCLEKIPPTITVARAITSARA